MADPTQFIQLGGVKFLLPSTAKIVGLTKAIFFGTLSLFDISTNAVYKVPAAKKLWILEGSSSGAVATDTNTFYHGPTQDSIAAATQFYYIKHGVAGNVDFKTSKVIVPANDYVTLVTSNTQTGFIIGVELDV